MLFRSPKLMAFHKKTGTLITLSNNDQTAQRRYASTEFNNGIVLSYKPLRDNEIFEVKIDKKVFIFLLIDISFDAFPIHLHRVLNDVIAAELMERFHRGWGDLLQPRRYSASNKRYRSSWRHMDNVG